MCVGIFILLILLIAIFLFPLPALAIPTAGVYIWGPGDLTGNFTSDSLALTTWDFTSSATGINFTLGDHVILNGLSSFQSIDSTFGQTIFIDWLGGGTNSSSADITGGV